MVILAAPDEKALRALAARLTVAQVDHALITEIDEPWSGQATAIGCALVTDRSKLRKEVSSLPLLR